MDGGLDVVLQKASKVTLCSVLSWSCDVCVRACWKVEEFQKAGAACGNPPVPTRLLQLILCPAVSRDASRVTARPTEYEHLGPRHFIHCDHSLEFHEALEKVYVLEVLGGWLSNIFSMTLWLH